MAEPTEDPHLDPEEEAGGPVKSFLEHLEDLRWVLIKASVAVLIAMIVCLLAVNQLVQVLQWPLERARRLNRPKQQQVEIYLGTNRLAALAATNPVVTGLPLTSNRVTRFELAPLRVGDAQVLALTLATNTVSDEGRGPGLIYLDPAAPFISSLHLAFFGGLLIASPLVFFFVGQFLVPAMKVKEKRYFFRALGVGAVLFLTGVCFCYFGIMPLALRAAEGYSNWMGVAMPEWRAEAYFSFVTKFMFGMGLGFELPVILLALVKIGILDHAKLAAMRRYMIVINLVLGALLTTPEVLTQVMMAIPLQILYECAVWIAWYWEWKAKRQAAIAPEAQA
jgi:sec-independent protein translocase protein TatC